MCRKILSFKLDFRRWTLDFGLWKNKLQGPKSIVQNPKSKIIFILLFAAVTLSAQDKRAELEVKRQKILQNIQANTLAIEKTKRQQNDADARAEALQNQIEDRQSLILNLGDELENTDSLITRTESVITAMQSDLADLKKEYGTLLRKAYRMRVPNTATVFLFASQNFKQSYQRWQYFRQYEKFRKREVQLILKTQKSLTDKNTFFARQRLLKDSLKNIYTRQSDILETERGEQDQLIKQLHNTETKLTGAIKSAEKQSTKISRSIENIIAAEISARKRAEEEARRKEREVVRRLKVEEAAKKSKENLTNKKENKFDNATVLREKPETLTDSPQTLELSSDFRSNKGKLPPPAIGSIVRSFGKQRVMDKVTAINNGIDIRTNGSTDARAVAAGTVSIVSSVPGVGQIVLIQHGNYYTVYANLSAAYVKKGETVSARQTIGKVAVNPISNEPELHFELWQERNHLNPADWLAK